MNHDEKTDVLTALAKLAPGVLGAYATAEFIVVLLTIIYLLLQIAFLIHKWVRERSETGKRLRHWSDKHGITQPGDLDE